MHMYLFGTAWPTNNTLSHIHSSLHRMQSGAHAKKNYPTTRQKSLFPVSHLLFVRCTWRAGFCTTFGECVNEWSTWYCIQKRHKTEGCIQHNVFYSRNVSALAKCFAVVLVMVALLLCTTGNTERHNIKNTHISSITFRVQQCARQQFRLRAETGWEYLSGCNDRCDAMWCNGERRTANKTERESARKKRKHLLKPAAASEKVNSIVAS